MKRDDFDIDSILRECLGRAYQTVTTTKQGEKDKAEYIEETVRELTQEVKQNDKYFKGILLRIATDGVETDLQERSHTPPWEKKIAIEQYWLGEEFKAADAKNRTIRLGGNQWVTMYEATYAHLMVRHGHKVENVARASKALSEDTAFLGSDVGKLLQENPTMTYGEAMVNLGRWEKPSST